MYTSINFKTKKAFKEAVANGEQITLWSPGFGTPNDNGIEFVEGQWYPKAHTWYAQVVVEKGIVVKVK